MRRVIGAKAKPKEIRGRKTLATTRVEGELVALVPEFFGANARHPLARARARSSCH